MLNPAGLGRRSNGTFTVTLGLTLKPFDNTYREPIISCCPAQHTFMNIEASFDVVVRRTGKAKMTGQPAQQQRCGPQQNRIYEDRPACRRYIFPGQNRRCFSPKQLGKPIASADRPPHKTTISL
ncbi:unnamed protein product [Protopolystoma xenopodis]|uniref:Uncharacterized protein n=1 Tax=Protopolystoma xenopodis TaxID=117903 RepID=A0A448XIT7_9PLAT|nr:unnamed protein product [Protopolystoma xenopodis]